MLIYLYVYTRILSGTRSHDLNTYLLLSPYYRHLPITRADLKNKVQKTRVINIVIDNHMAGK